jgi:hypothetical protein
MEIPDYSKFLEELEKYLEKVKQFSSEHEGCDAFGKSLSGTLIMYINMIETLDYESMKKVSLFMIGLARENIERNRNTSLQ